jgi:uncharacterized membrane protein
MFQRLTTLLKHLWLDESDSRRTLPPEALDRLRQRVAASEKQHSGEIRIFVEASLPASYLWRHVLQKLPLPVLARQRAVMMFSKLGVWDTAHNNGVLIYLLLAEREIELVADRGIHGIVGPQEWEAMVQRMAKAFAAGQFETGLAQAIDEISVPLVRHFALDATAANRNELPDQPALG